MQHTTTQVPRRAQQIQFRKSLLPGQRLMKPLENIAVNPLSQSQLAGETINNQLELLSQNREWDGNAEHICGAPTACMLAGGVAIRSYAWL